MSDTTQIFEALDRYFQRAIERTAESLEEFTDELRKDPLYTLEWSQRRVEDLIKNGVYRKVYARFCEFRHRCEQGEFDVNDTVKRTIRAAREWQRRSIRDMNNSTSLMSNVTDQLIVKELDALLESLTDFQEMEMPLS